MKIKNQKKQEKLLLGSVTLFWFAQYVYVPFQTPFLSAAGLSADFIGVVIGAYGVSQMLARLPVGYMADVAGRHKGFILAGTVFAALASLCRLALPVRGGFLLGNIISGLASAMWISFMVFYTDCVSGDSKEISTGRLVMFNNLGILLGFGASTLLYNRLGMPFLCGVSVLAGGAAMILALGLSDSPRLGPEGAPAVSGKDLLKVCLRKRLIFFALLAILQQGIQMATTMSYTTQVLKDMGASSAFIGASSIVYMVASVLFAGGVSSSRVFQTLGPRIWIPSIFFLVAAYCYAVPRTPDPLIILALQIIPGTSTGILYTYLIAEAMEGIPLEKKSTAMGFFQAVYAVGMTLIPMVTGYLVERADMRGGFDFLAILAILGAGMGLAPLLRDMGNRRAE